MLETGSIIKLAVKVNSTILMAISTKALIKTTRCMERESTLMPVVLKCIMVIGKMTFNMEKERLLSNRELNILVILKQERRQVKESTSGLMVLFTMDSGITVKWKALVLIIGKMDVYSLVNGKTA